MTDPDLSFLPLSLERWPDWAAFFDGVAFSDNPAWASCYCQCYYEDHRQVDWDQRTEAQNRACAAQRTAQAQMQGVLAYRNGRVVGWCNAAPRALLHALDEEPVERAEEIGVVMCFLVAPGARGQGIARALLDAACAQLREQGLRAVEANPRVQVAGAAAHHHGPLAMYLAAGFHVDRTDDDGSVWVRKEMSSTTPAGA